MLIWFHWLPLSRIDVDVFDTSLFANYNKHFLPFPLVGPVMLIVVRGSLLWGRESSLAEIDTRRGSLHFSWPSICLIGRDG